MTRVTYIVGKGRSGSTLLDQMLGTIDGWCSTGELFRLWDWGLRDGVRCGCGEPLASCPVWSAVLDRVGADRLDVDQVVGWRSHAMSWRSASAVLRGRLDDEGRKWCALMADTYRAIAVVTGARVVVDSSKWPANPGAHGLVEGVEPSVVHLVRDPRAVAHSWRRRKVFEDRSQRDMPRFSVASSALSWDARNAAAIMSRRAGAAPWVTVRYEDLVTCPDDALEQILATAGDPGAAHLRFDEGPVSPGTNHIFGGNPSKGTTGQLALRPDDEWRTALDPVRGSVTTLLCLPLLRVFDYPVRWRSSSVGPDVASVPRRG